MNSWLKEPNLELLATVGRDALHMQVLDDGTRRKDKKVSGRGRSEGQILILSGRGPEVLIEATDFFQDRLSVPGRVGVDEVYGGQRNDCAIPILVFTLYKARYQRTLPAGVYTPTARHLWVSKVLEHLMNPIGHRRTVGVREEDNFPFRSLDATIAGGSWTKPILTEHRCTEAGRDLSGAVPRSVIHDDGLEVMVSLLL